MRAWSARHLGRHIPGNPTVNVQVMPGAGGIRAANFLAKQAPKDGTAITTFAGGPILEPLIGARDPGYDMSQFTMIGAVTKDVSVCVAWAQSPFKTIDDVRKQQMIVAGTGAGSETDTWPVILNDVLGTKFKVVTGYLGSQETIIAIERGEAHGRCGFSLSVAQDRQARLAARQEGQRAGADRAGEAPELADVPLVFDLRQASRKTARCWNCWSGRPRWHGRSSDRPGMPADRATLLRRAFDATMKDARIPRRRRKDRGRRRADHRRGRAEARGAPLCHAAAGDRAG